MEPLVELVPLHNNPNYSEKCCKLLNAEWPRSDEARLHSLQTLPSPDTNLPVSLILLENRQLIGYCQLSQVVNDATSCFVASVVVWTHLRGRGYGRKLMTEAETFAAESLKMKKVYLTTHDKQKFYERVGYMYCDAIVQASTASTGIQAKISRLLNDKCSILHRVADDTQHCKPLHNANVNAVTELSSCEPNESQNVKHRTIFNQSSGGYVQTPETYKAMETGKGHIPAEAGDDNINEDDASNSNINYISCVNAIVHSVPPPPPLPKNLIKPGDINSGAHAVPPPPPLPNNLIKNGVTKDRDTPVNSKLSWMCKVLSN